jgi:hypothetical protein
MHALIAEVKVIESYLLVAEEQRNLEASSMARLGGCFTEEL